MLNIVFAWWWTWWHVFPIKSLIEFIKNDNNIDNYFNNIYWFGESNSLESKVASSFSYNKLKFYSIISWKIRREKSILWVVRNFIDIFKFFIWFIQSLYLLHKLKVDVLFCKWWYVAWPVVIAAKILWVQIFLHESDTVPWLANRLASKFSDKIFLWFPDSIKWWEFIWQILSDEISNFSDDELNISSFDSNRTNILVIWWSQWSKIIYETLLDVIKDNRLKDKFNYFIVLGTQNQWLKDSFKEFDNVFTFDFLTQKQIWYICNLCDVWITRGWATSLAEQKAFGMKLLIIPLPYTWWNHQYYNGMYYSQTYGDILINQNIDMDRNLRSALLELTCFKKQKTLDMSKFDAKQKIMVQILSEIKTKKWKQITLLENESDW